MRQSARTGNARRGGGALIGREAEISTFRRVLDGTLSHRIVSVSGFGGVGKSTLLEYLVEVAEQSQAAVGLVNARQLATPVGRPLYGPVIDALIGLAESLRAHGGRVETLTGRLERYQRLHGQLVDRFADRGGLVTALLQAGFGAVRSGLGLLPFGKALDGVFSQELVSEVSRAIAGHRRESDRLLLVQPVEELTAGLVADLRALAGAAGRPVVLCFDEYELMHPDIDTWLRRLFTQSLAPGDRTALLLVAGRVPLGQDWIARGRAGGPGEVAGMTLTGFTREEVVEYLSPYIDGPAERAAEVAGQVADRLGEPCRLPLVLRLLVAQQADVADLAVPGARFELGPLANALIDRLLDAPGSPPAARDVALAASVARSFDLPLLEAILTTAGIAEPRPQFDWLERQHFINPRAPAHTFYDLVREIFLTRLRATNPDLLRRIHQRLAGHFEAAAAGSGDRSGLFAVEAAYHRLCAAGAGVLPAALNAVLAALPNAFGLATDWSRTLGQVAAERTDLDARDAAGLRRLAGLVADAWRLASSGDARPGADLARNIFLTTFYDGQRPTVDDSDAALWLSYLECQLRMAVGGEAELERAESRLTEILLDCGAAHRAAAPAQLAFCVQLDLAQVSGRRGDLAEAVSRCGRALELARAQASRWQVAVALYHLSVNQKRQGSYRDALRNLDEAITLVRGDDRQASRYYLGRLLLDKANTHTYLNQTRQAEDMFEAARTQLDGLSPQSHAEVCHRIGWLKRVRGQLDESLADHELAVQRFRELEAGLLARASVESPGIVVLRAKALHSMGNVLSEMGRHREAVAAFDAAIGVFGQHNARRHVAIARKDRAWSAARAAGPREAEDELIRAIATLEDNADDRQRTSSNVATHLAEAWLQLALVRALTGRTVPAQAALAGADRVVGSTPDNQVLRAQVSLVGALLAALSGRPEEVEEPLGEVERCAEAARPAMWALSARAAMVRAVAADRAGRPDRADHWRAEAEQRAARWNHYAPAAVRELVEPLPAEPPGSGTGEAGAVGMAAAVGSDRPPLDATATLAVTADLPLPGAAPGAAPAAGELIDIYDAAHRPIGQATSQLAHLAGLWHRTFHCWIGGRTAEQPKVVVLQQRGPFKRDYPDYLDISAAGHYHAGERVEGGLREIHEELGLTVAADQLRLVARRTIDERLSNGVINREFQDIFLLERAIDLDEFRPSYPEVAAVYYCDLGALRRLLTGAQARADCTGIAVSPDGHRLVRTAKAATLADFIPSARSYLGTVLALLDGHLDGQRDGAGPAAGDRLLPDGSRWSPV